MIFNEISSFENEYKRFLGISFGKRILVQGYFFSDFPTNESGETYLFSLKAAMGHYQSKDMLLKICIRREFASQIVIFFNSRHLCSLCKREVESISHLFLKSEFSTRLWAETQRWCSPAIALPQLTEKTVYMGWFSNDPQTILINHILLLYKCFLFCKRNEEEK